MYSRFSHDSCSIYHNLKQTPQNLHLLSPTILVLFTESGYVLYDLADKKPLKIFRDCLWNFTHTTVKQINEDQLVILSDLQWKLSRLYVRKGKLQRIRHNFERKAYLIAERNSGNFHLISPNSNEHFSTIHTFNLTNRFELKLNVLNDVVSQFGKNIVFYGEKNNTFKILDPTTQIIRDYSTSLTPPQQFEHGRIEEVIHSVVEFKGMALVCLVKKNNVRLLWLNISKQYPILEQAHSEIVREVVMEQPGFLNFTHYFDDGKLVLQNCLNGQVSICLYNIHKNSYRMDSTSIPSKQHRGFEILGTTIIPRMFQGDKCKTVIKVHRVAQKNSIYFSLMKRVCQKYGNSLAETVFSLLNNEFA